MMGDGTNQMRPPTVATQQLVYAACPCLDGMQSVGLSGCL